MLAIIRKIEMDPDVVWYGTDEQADEYDRQCDECAECWRKIIEDPNFSALGFQYDTDYHILSRSTDDKGVFRLTYFWNGKKPNGKPISWIRQCMRTTREKKTIIADLVLVFWIFFLVFAIKRILQ